MDLATITTKIRVGIYDMYLHVGWDDTPRPVHVDLVLTPSPTAFPPETTVREATTVAEQIAFVKGALEVITRHASTLLEAGVWDLAQLCEAWRGTTVFHPGLLYVGDVATPQFASGPLDAAARVIQDRGEAWQCRMTQASA